LIPEPRKAGHFLIDHIYSILVVCLCISPFHPGLSSLILIFVAGVAILISPKQILIIPPKNSITLWILAIQFIYIVFFLLHGFFLTNSLTETWKSFKGNILLVVPCLLGLLAMHAKSKPDAAYIGRIATYSVCFVAFATLILYMVKKDLWGPNVIDYSKIWPRDDRLEWYSRNPLMLGSTLMGLIFLSLIGWNERSFYFRIVSLLGIFGGIAVVVLAAQARGAALLLLFLVPVSLWYLAREPKELTIALLIVVAASAITYILGIAYLFEKSGITSHNVQRFLDTYTIVTGLNDLDDIQNVLDASIRERLVMWREGLRVFLENPWVGYGYQNRFSAIGDPTALSINSHGHLHNDFINHAVAAGIPGVGVFLLWILMPLLIVFNKTFSKDIRYAAAVLFIVITGTALGTAALGHYVHANYWGILISLIAILMNSATKNG
jgi:O-antigen ligase